MSLTLKFISSDNIKYYKIHKIKLTNSINKLESILLPVY